MNLADDLFEPSDGTYRSLQAFFAATVPTGELRKMKAKFSTAQIPVSGFNRPFIALEPAERKPMPSRLLALFIILVLIVAIVVASHYVNVFILGGIISAVLVLYIVIEVVDLRRDGKLQEKSFVDLLKLVLTKRFQFNFGKPHGKDDPPI